MPIKEGSDNEYYMASGCNSDFEGELEMYKPILKAVDQILDAATKVVPPPLNAPIALIKTLLSVTSLLFDRMGEACGYLDDYVFNSMTEAAFQNTRYLLNEVACRPSASSLRGRGCDGIDNNCDKDFQVDECNEDQTPPEIDITVALVECSSGGKIFSSLEDANACVEKYISALDDCREVEVSVSNQEMSSECAETVVVNATALGCRGVEGVNSDWVESIVMVPVMVDTQGPVISCVFGNSQVIITKDKPFVNSGLEVSLDDDGECSDIVDVEIKMLSSESYFLEDKYHNKEMVLFSDPDKGEEANLVVLVESEICNPDKNDGKCLNDSTTNARTYVARVKATDSLGRTSRSSCSMVVYEQVEVGNFSSEADITDEGRDSAKQKGKSQQKEYEPAPKPVTSPLFPLGTFNYAINA